MNVKLIYAPGACSMADHIALIETGLPHTIVRVGRDRKTEDGRDFVTINPKGYTPALELEDGTLLTENLAILIYIAERSGKLLGKEGPDRWRAIELTTQVATELHPTFKPLFWNAPQPEQEKAKQHIDKHFALIARQLGTNRYLVGDGMTIADLLFTIMLMWADMFGIAVPEPLGDYLARMKAEPSVVEAMTREGLV